MCKFQSNCIFFQELLFSLRSSPSHSSEALVSFQLDTALKIESEMRVNELPMTWHEELAVKELHDSLHALIRRDTAEEPAAQEHHQQQQQLSANVHNDDCSKIIIGEKKRYNHFKLFFNINAFSHRTETN